MMDDATWWQKFRSEFGGGLTALTQLKACADCGKTVFVGRVTPVCAPCLAARCGRTPTAVGTEG